MNILPTWFLDTDLHTPRPAQQLLSQRVAINTETHSWLKLYESNYEVFNSKWVIFVILSNEA